MTDEPPRDPSAAPGAPSGAPASPPGDDTRAPDRDELDDAIIAAISDYLDGTLAGAARAEVAAKIAGDPAWQRAHAELSETRGALSGLTRAHAPSRFTEQVAATIHRRSAGRFFARTTLGDRVPFGALLLVALAGLAVIGYVLWASATGSLRVDPTRERAPASGSAAVAPP